MKRKLAIIGASYLQRPLVEKAKDMGLETHVFAWQEGCEIDGIADYFYPISILEKEEILSVCEHVGIDGIVSIASDIAMPTVNFVAEKMGLVGNTMEATEISTNKYKMRQALFENGINCPEFQLVDTSSYMIKDSMKFPVIVKPVDRSGSRGVSKIDNEADLDEAIKKAKSISLSSQVIVEEFIEGREFSVEMISFEGKHFPLVITDKVTTGAPYFVEIEHHQPAGLSEDEREEMYALVIRALDALKIRNGASHSELLLDSSGMMHIVEVAGRMGGDLIGSDLVYLSTGFDFLRAVIEVALGTFGGVDYSLFSSFFSGVYYVLPKAGKIVGIEDRSAEYCNVVKSVPILKQGDIVDKVQDGAEKRAGVIVYKSSSGRVKLNPLDVLCFDIQHEELYEDTI